MSVLLGLAPVVVFLAALVLLDSYKLVRLRLVIAVVAAGMAMAALAVEANGFLMERFALDFGRYTRYGAPIVEELLKAVVIISLLRMHRIGFLVDAAILGFAVGTGFALVENLYYLRYAGDVGLGTWLVRGFGTAIMHGGTTALFAVITLSVMGRRRAWLGLGFAVAVIIHSVFNHFFFTPLISTVAIAVVLPMLLNAVFAKSEAMVGDWLGKGFDADAEMLELINSGSFSDSHVGQYLHALKEKFAGPVVADLLCYLRLYTELALRAKGILLMRENGFEVPIDEATREKFAELRYLEKSIGRTGLRTIQPMLHMTQKELWQLYMIGK